MDLLAQAKDKLTTILSEGRLSESSKIRIKARGLTATEAIGQPKRTDYPIQNGKEVMIEADCDGCLGQAFTDQPSDYLGSLSDILALPLEGIANRALFVAALNAILRKNQLADRTVHCKDEEPEMCAGTLMQWLQEKLQPESKIGLIGLQPAMLEKLSATFGADRLLASDLNPKTIGSEKWGVTILDGAQENERLMDEADFVLVTGSAIVNGSFNQLYQYMSELKKPFAAFGNTISGVASLLDVPHVCFHGR
jgi:hypothetical protein